MKTSKIKLVVPLFGDLCSSTLLAFFLNKGVNVKTVSFVFPSRSNKNDLETAKNLCNYYSIEPPKFISLGSVFGRGFVKELLGGTDKTPVSGRELMFATAAICYAQTIGFDSIALGINKDTIGIGSPVETCISLVGLVDKITGRKFNVLTPFLTLEKEGVFRFADDLGLPGCLIKRCANDFTVPCGNCAVCIQNVRF